ncbi:MAG: ribose 5-phosphate isomerase B [Mycoplasmataceae bacterium]|jgi:RpiB/LacA/LacB family sugar-phosphate isomerase|nr:ribose 5-phosphate isomerase B [Mycoplasmataceae bacterium]
MAKFIYIGADHAGFQLKEQIKTYLENNNYRVVDCGVMELKHTDYPIYAQEVANYVLHKPRSLGILVCGTGYGMSIAANKFKKIRAVAIDNPKAASYAITHNDANIVCLSARFTSKRKNFKILKKVLSAEFSNHGRHIRRIKMISDIENCKKIRPNTFKK